MSNYQGGEPDSGQSSFSASGRKSEENEAERIESQANTNAVSRAIAVMILMLLPGVGGSYLDGWLGTQFFVLIGFGLGIAIAIFGLLYVAKIADVAAKRSRQLKEKETANPRKVL
ncbi:MAG: AtpZ/AtpI family protein [Planctomycetota bacterium]|nr:AtpZ/AtpI family protein [Planctomycetota bacterium]